MEPQVVAEVRKKCPPTSRKMFDASTWKQKNFSQVPVSFSRLVYSDIFKYLTTGILFIKSFTQEIIISLIENLKI